MDAYEAFRQKAKAENPEPKEIEGPTVEAILKNDAQSKLFGLYLEQEGEEKLGVKIGQGGLVVGREEFARLRELRQGFFEILERSKNVLEVLDLATLKEVIEVSPDLKDLAAGVGPEGMKTAFARYLPQMAILDREHFKNLSDQAIALKETKKAIAEGKKQTKALCREYDIDEKEYGEVLHGGDRSELFDLVRSDMGFIKKMWKNSLRLRSTIDKLDRADDIRKHLGQLDSDLKNVGSVIERALMDNEILHEALANGLVRNGEVPKLETGAAFTEIKKPKEEDVAADFETFQLENNLDIMPGEPTYEQAVSDFARKRAAKATQGKQGFWARANAAMWESMTKGFLKKK